MDIKILVLLAAVAHFVLGVLIIRKNYRNVVNICFALFSWVFAGWSVSIYFYEHPYLFSSLIWIKIVYLFVVLMITTILYFSFYFPVEKKRYLSLAFSLNVIASLVLFYILFFTNLWVVRVVPYNWGYETELGFGFKFFQVVASVFSVWIFFNLIRGYKFSKGIQKMQAKYMLSGMIVLTFLMIPTNILLPLVTGDSRYFWLSPILSLSFVGTTTYAIARYRLMDIALIVKKSLTYFLSVVFLMSVMVLGFIGVNSLMSQNELLDWNKMTVGIIIFTLGLLLFNKLINLFQRLVNKNIFKTIYTSQEALKKLSEETLKVIDLNKLIDMIVDTVMKSMGLNRAGVLLADNEKDKTYYRIAKVIGFDETNGISLVQDNFLTDYLKKNKRAVVFEELELMARDAANEQESAHIRDLKDNMYRIEAGVCLPLCAHDRLIGIIVLGNKISNEAFTKEDLHLLETLSNQASIAISNAQLYRQVEEAKEKLGDFNQSLQKKIDAATRDMKIKNQELEELLKMKSEFLTIASHQLRTPTSIVRGTLSMLNEEGDRLSEEQKKEFLEEAYISINHLERIVHDLLSATELEGGKIEYIVVPVDMKKIVMDVFHERKKLAEKKGLNISVQADKDMYLAMADDHKIEEVIANMIDNAINYTEQGNINISLGHDEDYIWVKIKDTGIGLTEKDREILFERFKRGEKVTQIQPNGSGLGLYIVKGVIEGLNGRITVDSAGKGKGSTFTIYLPKAK